MAKIRVYELARDLNMTNKELIEKLSQFGYPVMTHTNSLEEDAVAEFKNRLLKKPKDSVEETRVKPTVIRRRKKVKEIVPPKVSKAKEPESKVVEDQAPIAEPESESVDQVDTQPADIQKDIKKKSIVETEGQPMESVETKDMVAEKPQPSPPLKEKTEDKEAPESIEPIDPVDVVTPPKPDEAEQKPPKKAKKEKAGVKKRRVKKETAAKIIKLGPVPASPKSPEPEPKEVVTTPVKSADEKPVAKEPKKKKEKFSKKAVKSDTDVLEIEDQAKEKRKKVGKKRISFRKKEIVEGADLYSKENRGRKLRKGEKGKKTATGQKPQITTPKAIKRRIKIDDTIVLSELAKRMGIKANEIIKYLMAQGIMATLNQTIEFDTALLVASEFNYEAERASFEEESVLKVVSDEPDKLVSRPPVVTVMGHVDHGKTSLLDVIRKTSVTEHEAGGITQHIGAYHVKTERGQISFLDTPGHEAFTAMRSRGAKITDIVILVVAADDGVMPQTIEAINHAKAADVSIIVAVNKIDKPNADPDRVQRELVEVGLTPEEWGGETIFVKVSAKQGQGIEDLLEMVLLQAELLELKANPDKLASGHVVEAKLDTGRGPVATVLVQNGTLNTGDPVVCGIHYGKIRALLNDRGRQVKSAGPSIPVEIIGLTGVPNAGDEFIALADEKNAKQVSNYRIQKQRSQELARANPISLDNLFDQMKEGDVKDLNIIIRADVHGSIEALKDSLTKLSNEEVKINILHSATGGIAESDVTLAAVSDAFIIGFNVRPNAKVQAVAADEGVDIRYYNIIYNAIQDVQNAIVGLMASTFEEQILGNAEVREIFHVPRVGVIAGCYVTDGKVQRGQNVRLIRDDVVLYDGKIGSLRRFKDDAKEVQSGFECGIGIENYNDIKIGDRIECYYIEEIKPKI